MEVVPSWHHICTRFAQWPSSRIFCGRRKIASHRDLHPLMTSANELYVKAARNIQLHLPSIPRGIFCLPEAHSLGLFAAAPDIKPALMMFAVVETIPMKREKKENKYWVKVLDCQGCLKRLTHNDCIYTTVALLNLFIFQDLMRLYISSGEGRWLWLVICFLGTCTWQGSSAIRRRWGWWCCWLLAFIPKFDHFLALQCIWREDDYE